MFPINRARLLALAVAACVSASGCDRPQLSARLRREAAELSAKGRDEEALAALERAIAYDPADAAALERLFEISVRRGRGPEALRFIPFVRELPRRSTAFDNLVLRAEIQADVLESAMLEADRLERLGRLEPVCEQELVSAIAARMLSGWEVPASLGDRRAVGVIRALIARQDWAKAELLIGSRPRTLPMMVVKHELVAALHARDWNVDSAIIERLTSEATNALECLGRLDVLLRTGRELEALRLELSSEGRTPELSQAWRARWARHFALRADWYGVLEQTDRALPSPKDEARRQALRALAYLRRPDRSAARALLVEWRSNALAWEYWAETLLLPELAPHREGLTELRVELERRQRR